MPVSSRFHPRTARKFLGLTAAATLVGALAACGGSSPAATVQDPTTGLTTLKVQTPPFAFESIEMAQRHGIFEKHGLKVESDYAAGDPSQQIPKVASGEFDLTYSSVADSIRAIDKGIPIVITGAGQYSAAKGPSTDGLLVAPDSPITGMKDLANKTVGIAGLGSLPELVNNIGLKANGVDPTTVKYINLPNESLPEAASKGQVDAILPVSVVHAQAIGKGFKSIGGGTKEFLPNAPQIVWIGSQNLVTKNPEALKKFNDAMDEANTYAMANTDEIRAIDTELTKMPADFIKTRQIDKLSVRIDPEVVGKISATMEEFGYIKSTPVDKIIWADALKP